jgi:hypothetical protein
MNRFAFKHRRETAGVFLRAGLALTPVGRSTITLFTTADAPLRWAKPMPPAVRLF